MTTLAKLIAEERSRSAPDPDQPADDAALEAAARAELADVLGADLVPLLPSLTVAGAPGNVIASFVHAGDDYSLHVTALGIVLTRVDLPRDDQRRPSPYALFYERSAHATTSPRAWFLRAIDALTIAAQRAE